MASLARGALAAGAEEAISPEQIDAWVNSSVISAGGAGSSAESDLLADLVAVCREDLEDELGRSIVASLWTYSLDAGDFDLGDGTTRTEIRLPMPPLLSVETVTFYDYNETATVLSGATLYRADTGEHGRISLRYGEVWPTGPRDQNCLVIAYTGGYGLLRTTIPKPLLLGIKELTKFRFMHRGEGLYVGAGGWKGEVPDEVSKIFRRLGRYRIPVVA